MLRGEPSAVNGNMAYIARIKEDEICFTYFIKKGKR
jgi:hypothetical protein